MCSQILLEELTGLEITDFNEEHSESKTCTQYTKDLIDLVTKDSPLL
jgi:hypothetical protein